MLDFLSQNIGTIAVLLVVLAVVALIIFRLVKNKKKGKSSCGCNCRCCPNSALCHSNAKKG